MLRSLVTTMVIALYGPTVASPAMASSDTVVFYYGTVVPVDALRQFDMAVVDPDSGFEPCKLSDVGCEANPSGTQWIAYAAVGEVQRSRAYFPLIPDHWLIGHNTDWQSDVVDVAQPQWPAFFVEHVVGPLWEKGYRGFFLDTLDSYQRVAVDDVMRADSRRGLVALIRAVKDAYPEASLIMNRGFDLVPEVQGLVMAVAFESLFRGWDQVKGKYTVVSPEDRHWLLHQVDRVRTEFGLPVIAIDYCAPGDQDCIRHTAQRIRALGIIPYVADGHLQTVSTILAD